MKFHIIVTGEVAITLSDGKEVNRLTTGGYFGEVSVLEAGAYIRSHLSST